MTTQIYIQNQPIAILSVNKEDYISLTDMAHSQMQEHIIFKWMSLKSTIEYLGEWEALYNPNFNYTEFGTIRNMAGSNNFVLSTKTWIERTNAIGIVAKTGRYGGTYAHKDIAYHFGDAKIRCFVCIGLKRCFNGWKKSFNVTFLCYIERLFLVSHVTWQLAVLFFEALGKVTGCSKAHLIGYLADALVCGQQ